jgi:hypothetical protein
VLDNPVITIIAVIVIIIVVWAIAKFLLRLTGRVIGCVMTALIAAGILAILWLFVF